MGPGLSCGLKVLARLAPARYPDRGVGDAALGSGPYPEELLHHWSVATGVRATHARGAIATPESPQASASVDCFSRGLKGPHLHGVEIS